MHLSSMKPLQFFFFLVFFISFFLLASYLLPSPEKHKRSSSLKEQITTTTKETAFQRLHRKATLAKQFVLQHRFSSRYAFLIDMSLPSGKNRFFIYDFAKDTIAFSGLVAHGSCNTHFLEEPQFSNASGCGCTAIGRYKIGSVYEGRFGKAFKLYGLDSSNSNAFARNIVLHGYDQLPDEEVYPQPIANSLGCPMVSPNFLLKATHILQSEKKPVLLWIYQ